MGVCAGARGGVWVCRCVGVWVCGCVGGCVCLCLCVCGCVLCVCVHLLSWSLLYICDPADEEVSVDLCCLDPI